jgi:hypothetical protein
MGMLRLMAATFITCSTLTAAASGDHRELLGRASVIDGDTVVVHGQHGLTLRLEAVNFD